ncbi:hypothetical protein DSUL_50307 [Desulfovibrionales bacterium]
MAPLLKITPEYLIFYNLVHTLFIVVYRPYVQVECFLVTKGRPRTFRTAW